MFRKEPIELNRYRKEENVYCIDLYLTSLLQLFDRRDPSPFRERDLDEDFVRYMILSMHEFPSAGPAKIVIKMTEYNPSYLRVSELEEAIHNFFSFELETVKNDKETLFKQGRVSLLTGLGVLCICTFIKMSLPEVQNPLMHVVSEGLSLIPWVALWKPINIFLYDWWPFYDRIKIFKRLTKIKAEIITD